MTVVLLLPMPSVGLICGKVMISNHARGDGEGGGTHIVGMRRGTVAVYRVDGVDVAQETERN